MSLIRTRQELAARKTTRVSTAGSTFLHLLSLEEFWATLIIVGMVVAFSVIVIHALIRLALP